MVVHKGYPPVDFTILRHADPDAGKDMADFKEDCGL